MKRRGEAPGRKPLVAPSARLPVVAIVGRPNVGKSTLFNRLLGERRAIVEDRPGVTRDRHYAEAAILDRRVLLVDTGGFDPDATDPIWALMREQVELAIDEADVILFMLDARAGVTPTDDAIWRMLSERHEAVLLLANKADNEALEVEGAAEAWRLGGSEPLCVSAKSRRNFRTLRDVIVATLPADGPRTIEGDDDGAASLLTDAERELLDSADVADPETWAEATAADAGSEVLLDDDEPLAVAVVGKPNAGKSTLVNRLLGEQRHLTSDQPGTTRDSIDSWVLGDHRPLLFIDTAGIRRKARVSDRVERFSVIRALESIRRADVALLMIDGSAGLTDQDKKIAHLIAQYGKAGAILVNKWDAVAKDHRTADEYTRELHAELPYFNWAPVLFVSALSGQRTHRIAELVERVIRNNRRRLRTGTFNRTLRDLLHRHQPPIKGTRRPKIFFGAQTRVGPPTFVLFGGNTSSLKDAYRRYLERGLREASDFEGTPIRLFIRERNRSPSKRTNDKRRGRKER